VLKPALNLGCF